MLNVSRPKSLIPTSPRSLKHSCISPLPATRKKSVASGLACLVAALAMLVMLAAGCSSAETSNPSPASTIPVNFSREAAVGESNIYLKPAARQRLADLRICQDQAAFDGRSDTVSILTDDTAVVSLYINYEIYDCSNSHNSITILHVPVPERAFEDTLMAKLSQDSTNIDVIHVNYSSLHQLNVLEVLHRLEADLILPSLSETYNLGDFHDTYIQLGTDRDALLGIPITADASLIYFDSIALGQFDIPQAQATRNFSTFADLTDFCLAVNGRTTAAAEQQAATAGRSQRGVSSEDFRYPLALPLATAENRAKYFGDIMRSLASEQQNGKWNYGHWLHPDGTAAFASDTAVQALGILRDTALACMGPTGLDYTETALIEAIHNREILAVVLDASDAWRIYEQRDTTLWKQYEQRLVNLQDVIGPDYAPVAYSLMPSAGSPDMPVASYADIQFFAFPNGSNLQAGITLQLMLEATDQDSQESVKYFGVPTRASIKPTPLDPHNFDSTADVSPTNYAITHQSIDMGLPPEVVTPEVALAKQLVGEALANMLDSDFSPTETLTQAARHYESQRPRQ